MSIFGSDICVSQNGLHGIGAVNLLFAFLLALLSLLSITGVGLPDSRVRGSVDLGLGCLVAILTIAGILTRRSQQPFLSGFGAVFRVHIVFGAIVGLLASVALVIGGILRLREGLRANETVLAR